ncbi:hypothetical protein diail_4385 [Diaporthe ilicicola]|nr:hypothetical protein diail_4385 [Diaporthe ilicicola]
MAKPEQIRAVQDPIFHFYLQSYPKNGKFMTSSPMRGARRKTGSMTSQCDTFFLTCETASIAVMGPESSSEYFNINGSIQSTNTSLYLNVGSDSTSYKTLTLGSTASTSAWALEGDTIITAQSSSWGRRE